MKQIRVVTIFMENGGMIGPYYTSIQQAAEVMNQWHNGRKVEITLPLSPSGTKRILLDTAKTLCITVDEREEHEN